MALPFSGGLFSAGSQAGLAARDYDGTNDYATRTGLTGIADGQAGLISAWLRVDGGDGTERRILRLDAASASFRLSIALGSGNQLSVVAANATPTTILFKTATVTTVAGVSWRHFLCSWDMAQGVSTFKLFLDDIDRTPGGGTYTQGETIDYSPASLTAAIGAVSDGTLKFNGCLSEIFFHTSYLDLSVESNRRKFITANGRCAFLGANGSLPLGVQPLIYVPNGDPSTNLGSGGNFTVTGTLDVASTVPG